MYIIQGDERGEMRILHIHRFFVNRRGMRMNKKEKKKKALQRADGIECKRALFYTDNKTGKSVVRTDTVF
jgi:hypothetical protein